MKNNKEKSGMSSRRIAWGEKNGGRRLRSIVRSFKDALNAEGKPILPIARPNAKMLKWLSSQGIQGAQEDVLPFDVEVDDVEAWENEVGKMEDQRDVALLICTYASVLKKRSGRRDYVQKPHRIILLQMLDRLATLIQSPKPKKRKKPLDEDGQQNVRNMIRNLQSKAHISQSEMARLLRISPNTVSRWMTERNAISAPYASLITELYNERVKGNATEAENKVNQIIDVLKRNPVLKDKLREVLGI